MSDSHYQDSDELIRFVDRWKPAHILVAGDFMLDHYVYGNAQRLSPDAPVPVLAIEKQQWLPGGASNVCLDLLALRCKVSCLGIVGKDATGHQLKQQLRAAGCRVTGLVAASNRPTTIKQNFVGLAQHRHPQKMFRADIEDASPLDDTLVRKLIEAYDKLLDQVTRPIEAVILEDYNKGALTGRVCKHLIQAARRRNIPVLVDPAAIENYQKYTGATCLTPNRTEAALATGLAPDKPQAMARKLMANLKLQTLVLTLDRHGALLQEKKKPARMIPTEARSVYDVTGAGDMIIAMLAAALSNDADWMTAVQLANVAAGLEVERFGVVPVELDEVLLSLLRKRHEQLGKIRTLDQLLPELAAYHKQGKRIVFTNGCFDILHAGHVAYLRQARACGDLLVLGVNADASIERIKGPGRPVNKQADRLMVLSELESVDYVIVFEQDTPMKLLDAIRPDILVKGGDYTRDQIVGGKFVQSYGGEIKILSLVKGRSTTNIIQKIEANRRS